MRADAEKADRQTVLAKVCKAMEQRMVRLKGVLLGPYRAKKVTRLLMTESVDAIQAVFQQLVNGIVIRLRLGLEWAYSTVRMPCQVGLTPVSGVAETSTCWKDEERINERESDPLERRPSKTRQDFIKVSRSHASCNGRKARLYFFGEIPALFYRLNWIRVVIICLLLVLF